MKLIRVGKNGEEKPGIVIDGVHYDVSGFAKITMRIFSEAMDWGDWTIC
jgi:hypothetical protein